MTTTTAALPAANHKRELPEAVSKRGITEAQWLTLCNSLYPGADPKSVLMVLDYCHSRKLDPLKKPCHIVPMEVKDAKTNQYSWRDVVMPGIYELRTTAQRTGEYLGHSKPEYGQTIEFKGVQAVEWVEMTIYRWNAQSRQRVEFPVRTYFREVVALKRDGTPNARWSRAPIQMTEKCCEAKGHREAFPDEIGGAQTSEEMEGQRVIDRTVEDAPPVLVKPEVYDEWLTDLTAVSDNGEEALGKAWQDSLPECRAYLTTVDPETWDGLKQRASEKVL